MSLVDSVSEESGPSPTPPVPKSFSLYGHLYGLKNTLKNELQYNCKYYRSFKCKAQIRIPIQTVKDETGAPRKIICYDEQTLTNLHERSCLCKNGLDPQVHNWVGKESFLGIFLDLSIFLFFLKTFCMRVGYANDLNK